MPSSSTHSRPGSAAPSPVHRVSTHNLIPEQVQMRSQTSSPATPHPGSQHPHRQLIPAQWSNQSASAGPPPGLPQPGPSQQHRPDVINLTATDSVSQAGGQAAIAFCLMLRDLSGTIESSVTSTLFTQQKTRLEVWQSLIMISLTSSGYNKNRSAT